MCNRLRLVSIPHCNLPQEQIVLKCLKLNSTPCVYYGSFEKSECFTFPHSGKGTRRGKLISRRRRGGFHWNTVLSGETNMAF